MASTSKKRKHTSGKNMPLDVSDIRATLNGLKTVQRQLEMAEFGQEAITTITGCIGTLSIVLSRADPPVCTSLASISLASDCVLASRKSPSQHSDLKISRGLG